MENDERYLTFKEFAGIIGRGDSVDPSKLSHIVSEAEKLAVDERLQHSPNQLDLSEVMNIGRAMKARNYFLRREGALGTELMHRNEAKERLQNYVDDDKVVFQSYEVKAESSTHAA